MYSSSLETSIPSMLFWAARALIFLDLCLRILLAEINRFNNSERLSKHGKFQKDQGTAPKKVACVVSYREKPYLFERNLRSYLDAGCEYLVLGIDGNGVEDERMVSVFQNVRDINAFLGYISHGYQGFRQLSEHYCSALEFVCWRKFCGGS